MVIKTRQPSNPTDAYLNGLTRQIKIKSAKGVGVCVCVCMQRGYELWMNIS